MKNLLLFASLLFIITGCAKPDPEAEKVNAEAAVKGFYAAIENFDFEAMHTFCTKDFHAIEDGQVFNNLDEFIEMAKFFEGSKGQIKIDFPQTEVSGDVALSIVKFDAVWTKDPVQLFFKGIESYFLKKVNGKWLIDFYHSTYLPDEHDKRFTTIHFLKIPDNLPISDLSEGILKLNSAIASIGYPDCGYTLLKVIPDKDSKFNWVLEGNWMNPDVYKIIHENAEVIKVKEQTPIVLDPYFKDQIYLKVVLP
jgi:ketosteroid isomerase-like protein